LAKWRTLGALEVLKMIKRAFTLPEIDREKTKQRVESEIEKYRFCLLLVPEEKLPKITASYTMEPPAFSNQFHSSTETTAFERIQQQEKEKERLEFVERFRKAVNRLRFKERELIVKRYMDDIELYDYEFYQAEGLTESKFYKLKARAFYNLAFALRIEVYKNQAEKGE
jgi:ArpU family phage transcriptional regulator